MATEAYFAAATEIHRSTESFHRVLRERILHIEIKHVVAAILEKKRKERRTGSWPERRWMTGWRRGRGERKCEKREGFFVCWSLEPFSARGGWNCEEERSRREKTEGKWFSRESGKGNLSKKGMKSERKRIVISVSEIWFLDLNYAERSCSDLRTSNSFHYAFYTCFRLCEFLLLPRQEPHNALFTFSLSLSGHEGQIPLQQLHLKLWPCDSAHFSKKLLKNTVRTLYVFLVKVISFNF